MTKVESHAGGGRGDHHRPSFRFEQHARFQGRGGGEELTLGQQEKGGRQRKREREREQQVESG